MHKDSNKPSADQIYLFCRDECQTSPTAATAFDAGMPARRKGRSLYPASGMVQKAYGRENLKKVNFLFLIFEI